VSQAQKANMKLQWRWHHSTIAKSVDYFEQRNADGRLE